MGKTYFTDTEKKEIRKAIRQKYNDINKSLNDKALKDAKNDFLEKFSICETLYKILLKKYIAKTDKEVRVADLKIDMRQLNPALKKGGFTINEQLLKRLFNMTSEYKKVGKRSAKCLRNELVHTMNPKAMEEIKLRYTELISDMNNFTTALRTQ